jgi:hypothetical protein
MLERAAGKDNCFELDEIERQSQKEEVGNCYCGWTYDAACCWLETPRRDHALQTH